MIEKIGLDNLKIFYIVAKTGNITKASNELYISQPAVTQTIKKIEQILNLTLFLRTKKGVTLTNIGKELYARLDKAFQVLNSADKFLKQTEDLSSGELVYGGSSYIIRKMFSAKFKDFADLYPNIKFTQIDDTQEIMLNGLKLGEIDFVISQHSTIYNDVKFIPLFNEEYIFVCSKEYKNRAKNGKNSYIFQGEGTFNQNTMLCILNENKIDYSLCHKVVGYNMALELCKNDLGIAMLPKTICEQELKNGSLVQTHKDFYISTLEYGIYINEKNLTPICKEFLKEYL